MRCLLTAHRFPTAFAVRAPAATPARVAMTSSGIALAGHAHSPDTPTAVFQ